MFEKCPKCGRMHYRTDPCGATKSTAEPKAAPVPVVRLAASASVSRGERPSRSEMPALAIAPNSQLPVDTVPKPSGRPRSTEPSEGKSKRAAEMRDYMRQYRARKKADER